LTDRSETPIDQTVSFGPFRLLPAQQLLLEDESPVRLGGRALDILTALVERPGEVIGQNELMARVWPSTFVEPNTLRVHIASLRRALGDGQPGRRFVASIQGRGYRFVAPVEQSHAQTAPAAAAVSSVPDHNLPLSRARLVGRASDLDSLAVQLSKERLLSIVGSGGIGKTAVALALAEMLLPEYQDGIRFVDLAPVEDPQFVPSALGAALGLAMHPDNARLVAMLREKRMLIVLDSCEHVVEAAATLAEQLLAGAPRIHILVTSREPLRAYGERVHRLLPLEVPDDPTGITAARALEFPGVQLFVERAGAILDGFELNDTDAPIISDICRKLGGIALAIELAAARIDAFGVQQLDALLEDRFRILSHGRRTAQPRHRSLAAAIDWSYEFLPEIERQVLCRLAVFAGRFTLGSAIAVGGDDDTDVVELLANLVAKSLVSAEIGGPIVYYRLFNNTRAYAIQKLTESGELETYMRRHAQNHLEWFKRATADWQTRTTVDWLEDYGQRIDDIRAALNWTLSPAGDVSLGIALTAASIPLWVELTLLRECREWLQRALACQAEQANPDEHDELRIRVWLGLVLLYLADPLPENGDFWARTAALGERLGELDAQVYALFQWSGYCLFAGDFRQMLTVAERCAAVAGPGGNNAAMGRIVVADALHHLGRPTQALKVISPVFDDDAIAPQRALAAHRIFARCMTSKILWMLGFPDQAMAHATAAADESIKEGNAFMLAGALNYSCQVALFVGNSPKAAYWVEILLDCTEKAGLVGRNALGRCLKGALQIAHSDYAGLATVTSGLESLGAARSTHGYAMSLGTLAQALGAIGQVTEASQAVKEALDRCSRNEEYWCVPELIRIKGDLLRLNPTIESTRAAEDCFHQAMAEARRQDALSWELRAALSLANLWREENKASEARKLLSGVYDRFTEGFETADLRTARALINKLK
jgi:predicted ATPase/DNA-binding winged helix-turn-helix (wHTH) protein